MRMIGARLALIAVVATACTDTSPASTGRTDPPGPRPAVVMDLAEVARSDGAVMWVRLPSDEQLDAPVEGVLRWKEDAGCFLLERNGQRYGVVWPTGTTASTSRAAVVTSEGTTLSIGEYVAGAGGYLDVAELLAMPAECAPTADEVAVFNADSTLAVGVRR